MIHPPNIATFQSSSRWDFFFSSVDVFFFLNLYIKSSGALARTCGSLKSLMVQNFAFEIKTAINKGSILIARDYSYIIQHSMIFQVDLIIPQSSLFCIVPIAHPRFKRCQPWAPTLTARTHGAQEKGGTSGHAAAHLRGGRGHLHCRFAPDEWMLPVGWGRENVGFPIAARYI